MDLLDDISKATTDFLTAGCPWPNGVPPTRVSASATPDRDIKIDAEMGLQKLPGVRVSARIVPQLHAILEGRAALAPDTSANIASIGLAYDGRTLHGAVAHDVLQRKTTAAAGLDGFLSADGWSRGRRARAAASVTKAGSIVDGVARASYGPLGLFANTADALDAKNASASVGASVDVSRGSLRLAGEVSAIVRGAATLAPEVPAGKIPTRVSAAASYKFGGGQTAVVKAATDGSVSAHLLVPGGGKRTPPTAFTVSRGASGATMAGFDCVWARERDVTVGSVPVTLKMDGALGNVGLTLGATGPAGGDEEGTLV